MTGAERRDWTDGETIPFAEDEVLLPWLGTDEPLEERATSGRGRVLALIVGAAVLIAIACVRYWISNPEEGPVGANATPTDAMERPSIEAPGGESRISTSAPSPAAGDLGTGLTTAASRDARHAKSEPRQADAVASPNSIGVQVGAYASRRDAELGWGTLAGTYEELRGVTHRVVEAVVGGKTVYRLQAMVPSALAARELCDDLKARGADCWGRF